MTDLDTVAVAGSKDRDSNRALRKLLQYEMAAMACDELSSLLGVLTSPQQFQLQLCAASIHLQDPDYSLSRTLQESGHDPDELPNCSFSHNRIEAGTRLTRATIDPFVPTQHGDLFERPDQPPVHIASIPLIRGERCYGTLYLGSQSLAAFGSALQVTRLSHTGVLAALAIDNCLNRYQLARVSLIDPLTQANNRQYFDQRLVEEIARSTRSRNPLCSLMIDIDNFPELNANHGHQVGDMVLAEVAKLVDSQLRGNDTLARYNAEQLAALLSDTHLKAASFTAERVRDLVADHRFSSLPEIDGRITISVGVAAFEPEGHAVDPQDASTKMMERASKALHDACNSGHNKVIAAEQSSPTRHRLAVHLQRPETSL